MKKYLLLLFLFMVLFSCTDNLNKEVYRYEFYENSDLSVSQVEGSYLKYGIISEGDKVVFKYNYVAEDEEQIADDEYSESIFFYIDSNIDSFNFVGEDLLNSKTTLTKYCFCYFPSSNEKSVDPTGAISGKKIDNNRWSIDFDITFYGEENRKFKKVFILNQIN
ncbi:hypothetical protein [Thalassobellus sediminis]|uniref:hypothetical protein n=1 Tax=Thalassobellus sediminis TaxID=3367753 RepID=UPI0037982650